MFETILLPVLIIAGIGLIFGIILAVASKVMAVPVDERITKIRAALPGANCGACGFAGCDDYAKAVCENGAPTNACIPGGDNVAKAVASIMGVEASSSTPVAAFLGCQGTHAVTEEKYLYQGIPTCRACNAITAGKGSCMYGCLGFGDCMEACKFGAIQIVGGIAHFDRELCTGCGACAKACPKHLISILPKQTKVFVSCSNQEKGAATRSVCKTGCIGCKKCERTCTFDAIHVENNLASIDPEKCTGCGACAEACPVHAIITL